MSIHCDWCKEELDERRSGLTIKGSNRNDKEATVHVGVVVAAAGHDICPACAVVQAEQFLEDFKRTEILKEEN